MDDVTARIVRQWLLKAEHDLLNIRNNLAADTVPTDTVCFHAQQAIEKLMKGLLVANGRTITKTHDLVRLMSDAGDFAPELLPFEDHLEEISEYGVGVRYPDDFYDPSMEEARRAYDAALSIQSIIEAKIQF